MTKLLVSVRNATEAEVALEGGAHLIDVKEPSRGALGAADAETIATVVRQVGGRAAVSAAMGELIAADFVSWSQFPHGLQYAKLGLAGCARHPDWEHEWTTAIRRLPAETAAVAVIYADWPTANAPAPDDVLAAAAQQRCPAVLVDTFEKSKGTLLDHWRIEELGRVVGIARRHEMMVVLAGSLTAATIPVVLPLRPDYVAVRGAACRGGRSGRIERDCVRRLVPLLG